VISCENKVTTLLIQKIFLSECEFKWDVDLKESIHKRISIRHLLEDQY